MLEAQGNMTDAYAVLCISEVSPEAFVKSSACIANRVAAEAAITTISSTSRFLRLHILPSNITCSFLL